MLAAAKESEDTKEIAGRLEQALLKAWISSRKSGDEVFQLLKLDDDIDSLLQKPLLNTWVAFVEKLDDNPYALMLAKLKKSEHANTDSKLLEMIMTAKTEGSARAIAGKLEAAQLDKWLKDRRTADDVFKLLSLETEGMYLLWYHRTGAWLDYAIRLDSKNSDEIVLLVLKSYYDSDEKLARMLSIGGLHTTPKDTIAKGTDIVLNEWKREGKSAGDVFDIVLKDYQDEALRVPSLNIWISYVTKIDKEDPYKTMFKVLQQRFGESELNRMIHSASKGKSRIVMKPFMEQLWLSQAQPPAEVFKMLGLNHHIYELFDNPALSSWVSYVTKLDSTNADKLMFDTLTPYYYRKKDLAEILAAAKHVEATKALATKLEQQLLLSQGKKVPATVV